MDLLTRDGTIHTHTHMHPKRTPRGGVEKALHTDYTILGWGAKCPLLLPPYGTGYGYTIPYINVAINDHQPVTSNPCTSRASREDGPTRTL